MIQNINIRVQNINPLIFELCSVKLVPVDALIFHEEPCDITGGRYIVSKITTKSSGAYSDK